MSIKFRSEVVKRMAELMRAGAALTPYACPVCGTPLLRLRTGEYYCAACMKQVVIVKSEEEERRVLASATLETLRDAIVDVLGRIGIEIQRHVGDRETRSELAREAMLWVEVLDKLTSLIDRLRLGRGSEKVSERREKEEKKGQRG